MKTFILAAGLTVLAYAQASSSSVDSKGASYKIKHHLNQNVADGAATTPEAAASAMRRESLIQQTEIPAGGEGVFQMAMLKLEDRNQLQKRLEASEAKSQALEDKVASLEGLLSRTQGQLELLEKKVAEAHSIATMFSKKNDGASLLEETADQNSQGHHPPWPFKLSAGDNQQLVLKGFNLHIEAHNGQKGNLIIGRSNNYAEASNSLVVGTSNTVKGEGSVSLGGTQALAQHGGATLGGIGAQATGAQSVVVGGNNNGASGPTSTVVGGSSNEAQEQNSGVYGGTTLTADSSHKYQYKLPPMKGGGGGGGGHHHHHHDGGGEGEHHDEEHDEEW